MARVDYEYHKKNFLNVYATNKNLTIGGYCKQEGLNFGSAKRHLIRKEILGETKAPSPKLRNKKTSTRWLNLLQEFLVSSIKDPDFLMVNYAKEKGVAYPSLRRSFNDLKKHPTLTILWTLHTEQTNDYRKLKKGKLPLNLFEKRRTSILKLLETEITYGLSQNQ